MKKILALILVIATFALCFAGCGKKEGGKNITLMVKSSTTPFWITVVEGGKAAAEEKGYKLTVKNPVETSEGSGNEQQSRLAEEAIVEGTNCLVVVPIDSEAFVPAAKKVHDADIPIVNLNTKLADQSVCTTFVGLEDEQRGYDTAKTLFDKMDGKGDIILIEGQMGSQTSVDRVKGFERAVSEYPGIKVLAKQSGNWSRADTLNVVQNLLQSHPDVNAILCANDEMCLGAVEAVDAAGKIDQIKMAGLDAIDDAITAMREGKMSVTNFGDPYKQGYTAVMTAIDILEGKKVDKFVEIKTVVVDEKNIDSFNK